MQSIIHLVTNQQILTTLCLCWKGKTPTTVLQLKSLSLDVEKKVYQWSNSLYKTNLCGFHPLSITVRKGRVN